MTMKQPEPGNPSREDLEKWIRAEHDYLRRLGRLTNRAKIRIGLNIKEYADQFHAGVIAIAARKLGINEKTANEWVNFANRYRNVPEDQLPATRDEARKGRNARAYQKTGRYSKREATSHKPTSATANDALNNADANRHSQGTTAEVPKKKKKGGYATIIPLDAAGRPLSPPPTPSSEPQRPEGEAGRQSRRPIESAHEPKGTPNRPAIPEEQEQQPLPQDFERTWERFLAKAVKLIGVERLHSFLVRKVAELEMHYPRDSH